MKKIKYIYLLAIFFLFTAAECTKEDDGFFNAAYVSTTANLVTIETQPSYQVNDFIWINTNNFSRLIPETGQSSLLDVFETTNTTRFRFIYGLQKRNGDIWDFVTISSANFQNTQGEAEIGSFIIAKPVLNNDQAKYEFRGGIRITQPGEYRLFFGDSFATGSSFDISSDNVGQNSTYLTIATTANNLTGSFFNFTVN